MSLDTAERAAGPSVAGSLPDALTTVPPVALVIFGASGDLAARKIFPALARLAERGALDNGFTVIGMARTAWSDEEFRQHVLEATRGSGDKWKAFVGRFRYVSGEYDHPATFAALASLLQVADDEDGTGGNRLYYLATVPAVFGLVAGALAAHGCTAPGQGGSFARLVVEKPFGRDLDSAIALDEQVHAAFDESQVFRIDHYMGKGDRPEPPGPPVRQRHLRAHLEPAVHRAGPDHRGREPGGGAPRRLLRDGGGPARHRQNHVMQVLALTLMESPTSMDADRIRDEKVKLLQAIAIPTPDEAIDKSVRGQYGAGRVAGRRSPATGASPTWPRTRPPRPTWRSGSTWTIGAGRACPSTCGRASGCPPGSPRWRFSSTRSPTCSSTSGAAGPCGPTS